MPRIRTRGLERLLPPATEQLWFTRPEPSQLAIVASNELPTTQGPQNLFRILRIHNWQFIDVL